MSGWETLCEAQHNTGYGVNGGFAEYVLASPDYVVHLPSYVDFPPILCAELPPTRGCLPTSPHYSAGISAGSSALPPRGLRHVPIRSARLRQTT